MLWYCVKHSLQRRRQTPYQRGLYEHLFNDLEDQYPSFWTREGAVDDLEPDGFVSSVKWRLLRRWFAPEKTVNKRLYSSLTGSADDTGLGAWARFKRLLLKRWVPTIRLRHKPGDAVSITEIAEQGLSNSAPASLLHYEAGTINELAKVSTPVAVAEVEASAVQQRSTYNLQPLSRLGRKTSSAPNSPRQSDERPSSRGSSGIMIEERDLSDSEREAGEIAASEGQPPPENAAVA